jgi:PAS domain-containing protein
MERLEELKTSLSFLFCLRRTTKKPSGDIDQDIGVVSANRSFCRIFRVKPQDTQGKILYGLGNRQWDIPSQRELLEKVLLDQQEIDGFQVEHDFTGIGKRQMLLNARRMEGEDESERVIILSIEDVTDRACHDPTQRFGEQAQ